MRGSSVPADTLAATVTVSPHGTWVRRSRATARFLCVLTLLDGFVVMAGWILGLPLLSTMLPGTEPAKPDTAVGLMAAALAWLLLFQPLGMAQRIRSRRVRVAMAQVLAGVVLLIGVVVLAEIVKGRDIGLDTLFVRALLRSSFESYSQRMSAAAGASFLLLGAALLWLSLNGRRSAWPAQLAAHVILFAATVPLAGYLYDSAIFRSTPILGTTALPTALGLLAMSVALMAARPTEGVTGLFTSEGAGGHFARRAVILFVIVPFVLNWGEVFGELSGWYPQRIGWILESSLAGVGLLGLTWWVAAALNKREGERQQLTNALSQSLERFELVARATQDAIWDFDVKSGVVWWSDSYYDRYGYSRDTIPSVAAWFDHVHPEDRDRVTRSFNGVLEGRAETWSEEYRYKSTDGSYADVFDRAYIARDASGTVLLVSGSVQDITERRRLETQLRQAQKMEAIGQLAGGVAHDFNNLLTVVHGHASFIAEDDTLTPVTRESAEEIVVSAERAARLTRQLLLFSRRNAVQRTHFDVNDTLRATGRMLTRILGEDIHLEFDLAERPLFVDADASMVDQIVMNLVVNSRDAMPCGGLLIIGTTDRIIADDGIPSDSDAVPGAYVSISVSDTGEGIPPHVLPHIFEPFFSTKTPGRGTGLGLATVLGIVKQHRGWIDVESQAGEGTTFRVWLLLSEVQAAVAPLAAVAGAGGGSETVLLVEDEVPVLTLMCTALERRGYRVLHASLAAEALRLWQSHVDTIRLLVTDMVLPLGMSGHDLAAQLRAQRPGLKVLFVSGYSADFSGREINLEAGEHFLQKPFTPARLVESVRACLDSPAGDAPAV